MGKVFWCSIALLISMTGVVFSQDPPSTNREDDIVKVTTSLVQLDAVVTDKNGKPVNDLKAADFEVLQDGKPQPITNLSFIDLSAPNRENRAQTTIAVKPGTAVPPPPPAKSSRLGRIITFVVDDNNCKATVSGMSAIKDGLTKFINQQMQPDDLVAIYKTRAGSSLLQQYTSDKARLLSIAGQIRWFGPRGICLSGVGGNAFDPAENNSTGKSGGTFDMPQDGAGGAAGKQAAQFQNSVLPVLRYAIRGLRWASGRKLVFLMSESLSVTDQGNFYNSYYESLDIVAMANRNSVVIDAIDPRGLAPAADSFTAQDDVNADPALKETDKIANKRRTEDEGRTTGMEYLANETGGNFYKNMNSLDVPIGRVLASQSSYYLVGYEPDEETFRGKDFHKIVIRVKRPGLSVNSRRGFYGIPDEKLQPAVRTGDNELYQLLVEPLPNADLDFSLSAYFAGAAGKGNVIHANLHIDGKDIAFADDQTADKKVVFDVVAVTLDPNNKVIDDKNRTATVHIPAAQVAAVQRDGLIYTINVPVKDNGVYTFRIALRNQATKRIGAASLVIEIPELKKDRLYVSGLYIGGVDGSGKMLAAEGVNAEEGFSTVISRAIPAIREFHANTIVGYGYTIYDTKIVKDKSTGLTVQTNLFQNGKLMSQGKPSPLEPQGEQIAGRVTDFGYLKLNPKILPGTYQLQVVVTDPERKQPASQWIDFEIVE